MINKTQQQKENFLTILQRKTRANRTVRSNVMDEGIRNKNYKHTHKITKNPIH